MNFWKRSILLVLALIMTLTFVGCSSTPETVDVEEPALETVAEDTAE